MSQKFFDLSVSKVNRETPSSVSISFDIPAELQQDFVYKNGQYITIKHQVNGEEIRRSYSLCSAPQLNEDFTIAVKEVPGGKMSPVLNQLSKGTSLKVSVPEGNFTMDKASKLCLFAGGSGITPILSLLKQALSQEIETQLIYANTQPNEIIFKQEIEDLAKQYPQLLKVTHFVEAEANEMEAAYHGRISSEFLEQIKDFTRSAQNYICGPGPMMKFVEESLSNLGVAKEQVHLEYFEAPDEALEDTNSGAFSGKAEVTVILDDEEINLEVDESESILAALLRAGYDAPYSCQGGVCATCRAKVSDGEVYLSQNLGITDGEISQGYTLTCSSYPRSKKVFINFDEA